ncbi:hypothetical protein WOLCODRAFT_25256 [Wolfiporia cocos MD-104 SS10]|uniref:Uncharacterized protein n=1 Tax=Wolfiporia cocos (strain MD-104) TaxID=742152 RepID=A0A2H3JL72_WOLCO|nr:hypothetical protein WOLCODRAFT_25256 [Wolfiporia cocos MD-104 SS10]
MCTPASSSSALATATSGTTTAASSLPSPFTASVTEQPCRRENISSSTAPSTLTHATTCAPPPDR